MSNYTCVRRQHKRNIKLLNSTDNVYSIVEQFSDFYFDNLFWRTVNIIKDDTLDDMCDDADSNCQQKMTQLIAH